jgi:hypothetical protein
MISRSDMNFYICTIKDKEYMSKPMKIYQDGNMLRRHSTVLIKKQCFAKISWAMTNISVAYKH